MEKVRLGLCTSRDVITQTETNLNDRITKKEESIFKKISETSKQFSIAVQSQRELIHKNHSELVEKIDDCSRRHDRKVAHFRRNLDDQISVLRNTLLSMDVNNQCKIEEQGNLEFNLFRSIFFDTV